MFWPDPPIKPPNHPSTYQTIHPLMGGEFFTNFKSLNRIEISWLVQALSNFYWFRGPPPGGWQMGAWGWGLAWVCGGVSHAYMHIHACTCTHAHMHMHVEHDKHGCLHVGGHLQFLYMYTCACVHVCTCGDTPMPPDTHTHLLPPQSCREPKTPKFNKSWTNRDNSILFEDSLLLNIPELI